MRLSRQALFNIREHRLLKNKVCEMGFGDGQDLIVRRVVSRSGKHRVYINGALASLTSLAAIGESLINICGQHEHQMILDPENHTDILDEFGGLLMLRSVYGESYGRYLALKEKLRGLQELTRKRRNVRICSVSRSRRSLRRTSGQGRMPPTLRRKRSLPMSRS